MGGKSKRRNKLTKDQILTLYKAGPEAVVSVVEYLQDSIVSFQQEIEQLSQRLREVEEQLRKDSHNKPQPSIQ